MAKYIDTEVFLEKFDHIPMIQDSLRKALEHIPAADVRDNTKGHWRTIPMACYGGGTITEYECSECGEHSLMKTKFCPECGSDMRGGNNG